MYSNRIDSSFETPLLLLADCMISMWILRSSGIIRLFYKNKFISKSGLLWLFPRKRWCCSSSLIVSSCCDVGILERLGWRDGRGSQPKKIATAFPDDNHQSSFILENCLLHKYVAILLWTSLLQSKSLPTHGSQHSSSNLKFSQEFSK